MTRPKIIVAGAFITITAFLSFTHLVSAHAVVTPAQTAVSKNELYTASIPNEKDIPTVEVRLIVPEKIERITPIVKAGWNITLTKDGAGKITEIKWSGGSIPKDQKDLFQFSARTQEATTLPWKIYQTYSDRSFVSWDQDPNSKDEGTHASSSGTTVSTPYSKTEVTPASASADESPKKDSAPLMISISALLIAIIAVFINLKKK